MIAGFEGNHSVLEPIQDNAVQPTVATTGALSWTRGADRPFKTHATAPDARGVLPLMWVSLGSKRRRGRRNPLQSTKLHPRKEREHGSSEIHDTPSYLDLAIHKGRVVRREIGVPVRSTLGPRISEKVTSPNDSLVGRNTLLVKILMSINFSETGNLRAGRRNPIIPPRFRVASACTCIRLPCLARASGLETRNLGARRRHIGTPPSEPV